MTSFWGYLCEGIFLLILALWWMINTSVDVIKCRQDGVDFKPKITYTWPGTGVPAEILYKLFITSVGFFGQLFYSKWSFHDAKGDFDNMVPLMFITVYGIFLLHSIIDLLLWLRVPLIKGANYASAATGFFWYAMACFFSVDDFKEPEKPMMMSTTVSMMMWTFPMYLLIPLSACFALEPLWRSGVGTQVVRAYCLQTFATWSWHSAFILHEHAAFPGSGSNPAWDEHEEGNIAFTAAFFGLHLCINIVSACAIFSLVALYMRVRHGVRVNNNQDLSTGYGYTALATDDNSPASQVLKNGGNAKLFSSHAASS